MLHTMRFPKDRYAELQRLVLQSDGLERPAYLFAGINRSPDSLRLLIREVWPVPAEALVDQSAVYLEVDGKYVKELLVHLVGGDLCFSEVHSHPMTTTGVTFSMVDVRDEAKKFAYTAAKIGRKNPFFRHATMVLGRDSVDAHLYDPLRRRVVPIDRITLLDTPLRELIPTGAHRAGSAKETSHSLLTEEEARRYDRQVRAFGPLSQTLLRHLRIGIVGLGSTGMAILQQLALLGGRHFVLVDYDRVEWSNLNRLVGASPADAQQHTFKVEVARRLVHFIAPEAQVEALPLSVLDPAAHQALKTVDILFGATDNHGSRLVLNNHLAVQYLIPYIDVGTGLETDGDGHLTAGGGWVRTVLPGQWCLQCIDAIDREAAARDLLPQSERTQLRQQGYFANADVPAPSVSFLNSTPASLAVAEFFNLLTGFKPPHPLILYDLLGQRAMPVAASRRDDCPTCSAQGLLGLGDLEPFPRYELAFPRVHVSAERIRPGDQAPTEGEIPTEPKVLSTVGPTSSRNKARWRWLTRTRGRTTVVAALAVLTVGIWLGSRRSSPGTTARRR